MYKFAMHHKNGILKQWSMVLASYFSICLVKTNTQINRPVYFGIIGQLTDAVLAWCHLFNNNASFEIIYYSNISNRFRKILESLTG